MSVHAKITHYPGAKFNPKENNTRSYYTHKHFYLNGQCFTCHNFGHKVAQCVAYKAIITREARKQTNEVRVKEYSYNAFSSFQYETKFSFCNNFWHK